MTDNAAGRFLVATPNIVGPPFERSVILIVEHDATGAVGVVLNLETGVDVGDVLPDLTLDVVEPGVVFVGGPVSTDTAVVLGHSHIGPFTMAAPGVDVGIIDLADPPADLGDVRVYAGYSGWSPGQLEAELEEGSWWVLPADSALVFTPDPSAVWERLVANAPGAIPFHRHYPDDPSLN